ncbi:MAG: hypothetical protein ACRDI2_04950 [Chloroflexota bacterium]
MGTSDTHPDAEQVQIRLLRDATPQRRLHLAFSLSKMTRQLAWRAIQRANPDASEDELAVKFAAVCYGESLAERLRLDLRARKR